MQILNRPHGFQTKLNPQTLTPEPSPTGILALLETGGNCGSGQDGFLLIEEMRSVSVQPLWVNTFFIFFCSVVTVNSDSFHLTVSLEVLSTDVNMRAGVG